MKAETTPKRIQRKRTKGWRMPPNTVSVTRPGRWGNPFRAGMTGWECEQAAASAFDIRFDIELGPESSRACVALYRECLRVAVDNKKIDPSRLRGKNLACFCPLDKPCHADVLLEIANANEAEEGGR